VGIGKGGRGAVAIEKVEGGLLVLFLGLGFFIALPGNFSADTLIVSCQ